jgi:hypothetical protein
MLLSKLGGGTGRMLFRSRQLSSIEAAGVTAMVMVTTATSVIVPVLLTVASCGGSAGSTQRGGGGRATARPVLEPVVAHTSGSASSGSKNELMVLHAMAVESGSMKRADFRKEMSGFVRALGKPGFCRELSLAEAAADRLRTNLRTEGKPKSAETARRAKALLSKTKKRRGCRDFWLRSAERNTRRGRYTKAALRYALSARHLEISLHRYRDLIEELRKRVERKNNPSSKASFCAILAKAYRLAMSRHRAKHRKGDIYGATLEASAAQLLKLTSKELTCSRDH